MSGLMLRLHSLCVHPFLVSQVQRWGGEAGQQATLAPAAALCPLPLPPQADFSISLCLNLLSKNELEMSASKATIKQLCLCGEHHFLNSGTVNHPSLPTLLCHPQQPGYCPYFTVLRKASIPGSLIVCLDSSPSPTVLRLPVPETLLDNRPRPWHLRTCCFEFIILILKLFSHSEVDSSSRTQADL